MNLIEAIKSGRRFRRESWTSRDWINAQVENRLDLPIEAIVASDWEIEQAPATITRKQFFEAYAHAVAELPSNPTNSLVLEMMADRLGL